MTLKLVSNKIMILVIALCMLCVPVLALSGTVNANTAESKRAACEGVGLTTGSRCGGDAQGSIRNLISTIVQVLSLIVGIAAVIMIIVAGFKYITSGGESSNVSSAKNTLLYAVVGLIIVALAQVIVRFVLNQVPGS